MTWIFLAFSGPVLWAISMHFDKYLVERFFKKASVALLLVFTTLTGLLVLPAILVFRADVVMLDPASVAVIIASGLLIMVATYLYLAALQTEEVSVVAPFFQASPLFAYALGYVVLGETLSTAQMFGGALIIAGGLMLTVRLGATAFKLRTAVLMLACAFAASLTSLIFKIFAVRVDFWTTMFWTFVGQAIFGAAVLSMARYREEFRTLLRSSLTPLLTINAVNELINLGATLGARYALVLAPLSLVQAITSTTPLFVFLFRIALTIAFPSIGREDLSLGELFRKGTASGLVAIGVILVAP
jgi:drug/metabolite transporter (DMT)-like permease